MRMISNELETFLCKVSIDCQNASGKLRLTNMYLTRDYLKYMERARVLPPDLQLLLKKDFPEPQNIDERMMTIS